MPQFAANLTMLFTEHPFLERFEAAATPDSIPSSSCSPTPGQATEIKALLDQHGLQAGAAQPARGRLGRGRPRHRLRPHARGRIQRRGGPGHRLCPGAGRAQLNCLAGKVPAGADPMQVAPRWSRTCALPPPS
jgi:hydroxypyruvate isomerase